MLRNLSCCPEGRAKLPACLPALGNCIRSHTSTIAVVDPVTTCVANLCEGDGADLVGLASLLEVMVMCTVKHATHPRVLENCVVYFRRLASLEAVRALMATLMPPLGPILSLSGHMQNPLVLENYLALCVLVPSCL
jgi:hypothetical protein